MIEFYKGDIFTSPINILIHSANCFCTMGAGIAKDIKLKFPRAYDADCMTVKGDKRKLGQFSLSLSGPDQPFHILNCYTQYFYSRTRQCVEYDKFYEAINNAKEWAIKMESYPVIGCPDHISCRNAGGSWDDKILPALNFIFDKDNRVKLLICKNE